jgi:F-type H+-transporting ATPase subunit b
MWEDPTFWVAVAFIAFVVLTAKPIGKAMTFGRDKRSEAIRNEIENAQTLREDAQKLLADYKRKQRDAIKEVEEILAHARIEIDRLKKTSAEDLAVSLKRREQGALDKIAQAESKAVQDVREQAIQIALTATGSLICENMDSARADALLQDAIKELPQRLN